MYNVLTRLANTKGEEMNFADYKNTKPYVSRKTDAIVHAEYTDEAVRIYTKFKLDLFEELDIVGHPKAEKLLAIAWEYGHSSGYQEVYNYACELAELLH